MLQEFLYNFVHNLFKPLLLFFYAGFAIPLLKVQFEFPKAIYQGLTIYLLLAIGWHGGEELAALPPQMISQAAGFVLLGFATNLGLGFAAYYIMRRTTWLRRIDAATVAGYYGSDSAGTFVTCLGVLTAAQIAYAPYMPVLLAVMEIPGCLVALILVSRLRRHGMDAAGNMPDEEGYVATVQPAAAQARVCEELDEEEAVAFDEEVEEEAEWEEELVAVGAEDAQANGRFGRNSATTRRHFSRTGTPPGRDRHSLPELPEADDAAHRHRVEEVLDELEATLAVESTECVTAESETSHATPQKPASFLSRELLHEVFLNPGIFLLFSGIAIGFISRLQGEKVTSADDALFVNLFQGMLCLFLLEMGMTASQKLKDLRTAGLRFIAFGLLAPNLFAITGMCLAHLYSLFLGQPFATGTYALFAVLCAAASYIALPAVQRLAIPEASPTLPLAASLGLTFTYNVTMGIPVYILVGNLLTTCIPV